MLQKSLENFQVATLSQLTTLQSAVDKVLSIVTKELPVKVLQTCPNCLNTSLTPATANMDSTSECPGTKRSTSIGSNRAAAIPDEQTVPEDAKQVENFGSFSFDLPLEPIVKKETNQVTATPKPTASQSSSDDLLEIDFPDISSFSHFMEQIHNKEDHASQKPSRTVASHRKFTGPVRARRKDASNAPIRTRARSKRLRHTADSSDEDDAVVMIETKPSKSASRRSSTTNNKENNSDCVFLTSPMNSKKIEVSFH